MADLSRRFADLMARMARSDADLFRTLGEQNAAVRRMVEEVSPSDGAESASSDGASALAPASLLPIEECSLARLKARFHTLPPARSFLEARLGPPPAGIGRITWAVVETVFRSGRWPAGKVSGSHRSGGTAAALAGVERRLGERFDRMEVRLDQIELLLLQVLEGRASEGRG
jgi:hypothetical protein